MTLAEIKNEVMFQTNNDIDDLGDFLPYLNDYVNEGYDRLVYVFAGVHTDNDNFPKLTVDKSSPNLPEWAHRAIADFATWLIYRNGNIQKQNRGRAYLDAFLQTENKLAQMTDEEKAVFMDDPNFKRQRYGKKFINIPW